MKKFASIIVLLILSFGVRAQVVPADRIIIKDKILFRDYWIKGIQRDTGRVVFPDSTKIPTAKAVADYVAGQIAALPPAGITTAVDSLYKVGDSIHYTIHGRPHALKDSSNSGTVTTAVDSIYKAGDSIHYTIHGRPHALKDSSNTGTVTIIGDLPPLFTVANPSTTPTFIQSNVAAFLIYCRGSGTGLPSFQALDSTWLTGMHTELYFNGKYVGLTGNQTIAGTKIFTSAIHSAGSTYATNSISFSAGLFQFSSSFYGEWRLIYGTNSPPKNAFLSKERLTHDETYLVPDMGGANSTIAMRPKDSTGMPRNMVYMGADSLFHLAAVPIVAPGHDSTAYYTVSQIDSVTYRMNRRNGTGDTIKIHNPLPKYKVYIANLTENSSTDLSTGPITIGETYTIDGYVGGDDFTNVGASSNGNGIVFMATGTTPTTWINGTHLISTGNPVATVFENTLGGIIEWSWSSTGNYQGLLAGAFPEGKVWFGGCSSLQIPGNYAILAAQRLNDDKVEIVTISDNNPTDQILLNSSIEIRVYY